MTKEDKIKELVKEWMKKAKEDLITAETLINAPKERLAFLTAAIGFHSQQCVEKSLKTFLISKQIDFRRSHDINYLLNLCRQETDKFEEINDMTNILNDYAVNTRYPGDYGGFSIDEAKGVIRSARMSFELLKELLDTE